MNKKAPNSIQYNLESLTSDASTPLYITRGGLMLCLNGSSKIAIDFKEHDMNRWDLVVAFPYSIIQFLSKSDDFECLILTADINFFSNINIVDKSNFFTSIRSNPIVRLEAEDADKLLWYRDTLAKDQETNNHPFRNEIDECYMKIIMYEVASIYHKREPQKEQLRSREDVIFNNFIYELFNNYKISRKLDYYAQKQSITSSHLSKVVKLVSRRSASLWINDYTIQNIKNSLQDLGRSISEISDEYNFQNSSFFAQYFKRYTGMSPREYRATLQP